MGITETVAGIAVAWLGQPGFVGALLLVVLMTMESMVIPVPSEAVMPFAGFLVFDGRLGWAEAIALATLGTIIGSTLSYLAGYYGGRPFVRKFGRYLFLDEGHLDKAQGFYERRGALTVLVCRFIPIIRHLSSIPAGFARMGYLPFILLTLVGGAVWNATLTAAGYFLRQNWTEIMKYSSVIDIAIVAFLVVLVALFFIRHARKGRAAGRAKP